jgi:1-deoxy-D-xylulose-5-phosphate reductoisomerase
MMNKGMEVLEARWLFDLDVGQISIWVHPQSIVHSLVEFVDGSMIAQLGITDMGQPILYALNYPRRLPGLRPSLDLNQAAKLEFMPPDSGKFPCLDLAYQAARELGALPCTLNAADEVAVEAFLQKKIDFPGIPRIVAKMMERANGVGEFSSIEEILEYDESVRRETRRLIQKDFG